MVEVAKRPVLMLDKSFQAYDAKTVDGAFSDVISQRAQFVDESYCLYDIDSWIELPPDGHEVISTPTKNIRLPEVIRFPDFVKDYSKSKVLFSRKNLWKRDGQRCQFCGIKPHYDEVTIDHVIPKNQGGISSFDNCVIACFKCNIKKGGRTPQQAGMKLRSSILENGKIKFIYYDKPKRPDWNPIYNLPRIAKFPSSWKNFLKMKNDELYWHVELLP